MSTLSLRSTPVQTPPEHSAIQKAREQLQADIEYVDHKALPLLESQIEDHKNQAEQLLRAYNWWVGHRDELENELEGIG